MAWGLVCNKRLHIPDPSFLNYDIWKDWLLWKDWVEQNCFYTVPDEIKMLGQERMHCCEEDWISGKIGYLTVNTKTTIWAVV